ncbi:MAG: hypothetical protein EZS28_024566, partial [Streblomastix strix]
MMSFQIMHHLLKRRSLQTFKMSISSQSLSSFTRTGDKDIPHLDKVRSKVLRLLKFKIREILASLKFQETELEPKEQEYDVKIQLIFTVLIDKDKEKQEKEPNGMRLKVLFLLVKLNMMLGTVVFAQRNRQTIKSQKISWKLPIFTFVEEMQNKISQIVKTKPSLAQKTFQNVQVVLKKQIKFQEPIKVQVHVQVYVSSGQKGEVSNQSQREQEAGSYRMHQIEGEEMNTYSQPRNLQNNQAQSKPQSMRKSRNLCLQQKTQLWELSSQSTEGHHKPGTLRT